ncbi:unnamed protein product, partial [Linum tenue]
KFHTRYPPSPSHDPLFHLPSLSRLFPTVENPSRVRLPPRLYETPPVCATDRCSSSSFSLSLVQSSPANWECPMTMHPLSLGGLKWWRG